MKQIETYWDRGMYTRDQIVVWNSLRIHIRKVANEGASARCTTVNEIETGSAYEPAAIETSRMCSFVGSGWCLKVGKFEDGAALWFCESSWYNLPALGWSQSLCLLVTCSWEQNLRKSSDAIFSRWTELNLEHQLVALLRPFLKLAVVPDGTDLSVSYTTNDR